MTWEAVVALDEEALERPLYPAAVAKPAAMGDKARPLPLLSMREFLDPQGLDAHQQRVRPPVELSHRGPGRPECTVRRVPGLAAALPQLWRPSPPAVPGPRHRGLE